MQRVAGQFVVKKFADQLLGSDEKQAQQNQNQNQQQGGAPEQQNQQHYAPAPQAGPAQVSGGELNGNMIYDDDGNRLGIARHVSEVSVYLISHNANELNRTLQQAVNDPDTEIRFSTDNNGRVTGLIYVPSSARAAQSIPGIRSDDI